MEVVGLSSVVQQVHFSDSERFLIAFTGYFLPEEPWKSGKSGSLRCHRA